MKTKWFRNVFLLGMFFALAALFIKPVHAQAAAEYKSYNLYSADKKCGKYYFHFRRDGDTEQITYSRTKSGPQKVLVSAEDGYDISGTYLSDGKTMYYVEEAFDYTHKICYAYIYRVNIAKRTKKKISRFNPEEYAVDLVKYYNKCLYYEVGAADFICVYQYDLSTKKHKMVVKYANVNLQYKQYLICTTGVGDMPFLMPLYVYDCKAKKKITISKKHYGYNMIGSKLYYAESTGGDWDGVSVMTWNVKTSDLSGRHKKTLVKNLEASYVDKISSSRVYYSKYYISGEIEYYCYNIKTGNTKRIDEDEYRKRLGW